MGDHFETRPLVRAKEGLGWRPVWGVAGPSPWAGRPGFFKYFTLEQYEDAIGRSVYAEDECLFRNTKMTLTANTFFSAT